MTFEGVVACSRSAGIQNGEGFGGDFPRRRQGKVGVAIWIKRVSSEYRLDHIRESVAVGVCLGIWIDHRETIDRCDSAARAASSIRGHKRKSSSDSGRARNAESC